jgi:hypothetical protein
MFQVMRGHWAYLFELLLWPGGGIIGLVFWHRAIEARRRAQAEVAAQQRQAHEQYLQEARRRAVDKKKERDQVRQQAIAELNARRAAEMKARGFVFEEDQP